MSFAQSDKYEKIQVTPIHAVEIDTNDLPPGIVLSSWSMVNIDKLYYFYVPPGTDCNNSSLISKCVLQDVNFKISWGKDTGAKVNSKSKKYKKRIEYLNSSVYTLERYQDESSDLIKFVGKIQTAKNIWATVEGEYQGEEAWNNVFDIFVRITKS